MVLSFRQGMPVGDPPPTGPSELSCLSADMPSPFVIDWPAKMPGSASRTRLSNHGWGPSQALIDIGATS